MLLPEENFGTQLQHMTPLDTIFMKVDPGVHLDGIQMLFKNIFGSEVQVGRSDIFIITYLTRTLARKKYKISCVYSKWEIWHLKREFPGHIL